MSVNIPRMVAELRSELELIDVAIHALERFARSIGVEDDDPTPQNRSRRKPVSRESESSDTKVGAMDRLSEEQFDET
jgi:hypothetical protein